MQGLFCTMPSSAPYLYGVGCLLALACGVLTVDPYLIPLWNAPSQSNAMLG